MARPRRSVQLKTAKQALQESVPETLREGKCSKGFTYIYIYIYVYMYIHDNNHNNDNDDNTITNKYKNMYIYIDSIDYIDYMDTASVRDLQFTILTSVDLFQLET